MHLELETARRAARAGAKIVSTRGRDLGAVQSKSTATDMVTETDIAAGVAAVREIMAIDSSARFVIEEPEVHELADAPRGQLDDPEVWVLDPLDGTTSYVHGYPCFSVAVALLREGTPVAGAVYNVAMDELVSAAEGFGAWSGDASIRTGTATRLDQALLITGFPYDRGALLDKQLEILGRFLRSPVHGIRRDGSAAVDCTHVAAGRADGFWEFGLKPWDMAAGIIILREAGAHVTGIDGKPWSVRSTGLIAANPHLHEPMSQVILGELTHSDLSDGSDGPASD